MAREHALVRQAISVLPRWHVVHWGTHESSTLLCLWVSGRETLVPVDGHTVTYRGCRLPIHDGQLVDLLREIQQSQDRDALSMQDAITARTWLLTQWRSEFADGAMGVWSFPRGGFVRWVHNASLHLEAGDSGPADHPMPVTLLEVLVDLGWNPPDDSHRNCWLQPARDDLEPAADIAVLTPLAAFGFDSVPPWE